MLVELQSNFIFTWWNKPKGSQFSIFFFLEDKYAALLVSLGQFTLQNNNEHAHGERNHREKTHQSLPGKHLLKEQQMRAFHQLRKKEKTLK